MKNEVLQTKIVEHLRKYAIGKENCMTIAQLHIDLNVNTPPNEVGITRESIRDALIRIMRNPFDYYIKRETGIAKETNKWAFLYWYEPSNKSKASVDAPTMMAVYICRNCNTKFTKEFKLVYNFKELYQFHVCWEFPQLGEGTTNVVEGLADLQSITRNKEVEP
jgi:hypothetical protein